jgi:hypothetical protein
MLGGLAPNYGVLGIEWFVLLLGTIAAMRIWGP